MFLRLRAREDILIIVIILRRKCCCATLQFKSWFLIKVRSYESYQQEKKCDKKFKGFNNQFIYRDSEIKNTDSTMAENMESSATSTNSSNSYVIRGQIFEGDYNNHNKIPNI